MSTDEFEKDMLVRCEVYSVINFFANDAANLLYSQMSALLKPSDFMVPISKNAK